MRFPFVSRAKRKLGPFVLFVVVVSFCAGEVAAQDAVAPAPRFKLYGWVAVLGMQEIGRARARSPEGLAAASPPIFAEVGHANPVMTTIIRN